ncbi:TonB-dependent receptor [Flavilitoribacter nigricans]|uniref:Outer membrane protein beta-barrel domain-containing protein n=1 Tax=Flavilitoribacter nigricans (strain ATCC 23147 / DSM 23189 / NBRC 102662 / NCIMB 1420 / SS-2) TaxID=1122177 RepID=A0A2D0NI60_FLAN2|nr:hypothetical protein [Flavilitoribacter nigricans]PHN08108.1 hypothetical protein CRP01_01950 [Flavilitoribacter nigricans DSM 23189 = NBRC 102662]
MENVERILKQSDRQLRSFPVDEHRWQRLQASLRARKRRRQFRHWVKRMLPLLLLLFLLVVTGHYFRSGAAGKEPLVLSAFPIDLSGAGNDGRPEAPLSDHQNAGPLIAASEENALESLNIQAKDQTSIAQSGSKQQARISEGKLIQTNQPPEPPQISGLSPSLTPQQEVEPMRIEPKGNRTLMPALSLLTRSVELLPSTPPQLEPKDLPPPRRRKWVIGISTGLIRGQQTLAPARYLDEQTYSGQLVSTQINGLDLYELDAIRRQQIEIGRSLSLQVQCLISDRLSIALSLHQWRFRYRGQSQADQNVPGNIFTQRITLQQQHWLSGIGLRYRLLDWGRWQFQLGSYTLLTLSNRSESHLEYWQNQQRIGTETLIRNTPWEHSMRIQVDGQLTYRLTPNWQLGLGGGCLLDSPLLPYLDLRLQVRL